METAQLHRSANFAIPSPPVPREPYLSNLRRGFGRVHTLIKTLNLLCPHTIGLRCTVHTVTAKMEVEAEVSVLEEGMRRGTRDSVLRNDGEKLQSRHRVEAVNSDIALDSFF
jgi:hypothetical protein